MDRDNLIEHLPSAEEFDEAPAWRQKKFCEDFIDAILTALANERREPDEWEARGLAASLGSIKGQMYRYSRSCAIRALTPPAERSALEIHEESDVPTADQLRKELEFIRGMPSRDG